MKLIGLGMIRAYQKLTFWMPALMPLHPELLGVHLHRH